MMENIEIRQGIIVGDKIIDKRTNTSFRILDIANSIITLCDTSTTKSLKISYMPANEILNYLENNTFEIVNEERTVIDVTSLTGNTLKQYNKRLSIVTELEQKFSSDYFLFGNRKNQKFWSEASQKYNLSKDQLKRIYVQFLQSGRQFSNLAQLSTKRVYKFDGNQRGRHSSVKSLHLQQEDILNIQKILKSYVKNPVSSLQDAYHDLIIKYYSKENFENGVLSRNIFPPEQRPSFRQFYYYYSKTVPQKDRLKKKLGGKDYRNNERVFTGSVMDNVLGPGDVIEMDAHEIDVSMVSKEYPDSCVGRPILYLMIDVYTRMILSVSVALDNNSVVASTNCFMNLVQNKTELLQQYDISFQGKNKITLDDIWPSFVCPNRLRFDHGSDFVSKEVTRIVNELKINVDHVPPGMGSMKPVVERIFGDIEKQLKDALLDNGLIRKVYNSKHHAKSCLDIDDVMFIILNYVIYHNQRYMDNYQLPVPYIKKGVKPIPMMLWQEGTKTFQPRRLPDKEQFLYSILTPCTAKINREGIFIDKLKYLNTENDITLFQLMQAQGKKKSSFAVRRDMRDVSHIYYLRNGKLMQACLDPLNPVSRTYYGISVGHYEKLMKIVKENDKAGKEQNLQLDVDMKLTNQNVVKAAKRRKTSSVSDTKNLRLHREFEKNMVQVEHSVAMQIEKPAPAEPVVKQPVEPVVVTPTFSDTDTPEERQKKLLENARKMFDD